MHLVHPSYVCVSACICVCMCLQVCCIPSIPINNSLSARVDQDNGVEPPYKSQCKFVQLEYHTNGVLHSQCMCILDVTSGHLYKLIGPSNV